MAKNQKGTDSLFADFKTPKLPVSAQNDVIVDDSKKEVISKSRDVEEKQIVESKETIKISDSNIEESISLKPISNSEVAFRHVIDMPGRPRIYSGKYHNYAARLRNDVFEYIKTQVGENRPYKSMNEFINALVLDHMENNSN